MPYKRIGKLVYHKKGGKWRLKQRATSERNAAIIISNLEKLEKHPGAKVFAEAKKKAQPGKALARRKK